MTLSKNKLARNLKFLRSMLGLSQKGLADELGINRNKIASYESRNIEPSLSLIVKISAYFKISIDDLLTEEVTQENYNLLMNNYLNKAIQQREERRRDIKENGYLSEFIKNNEQVTRVYEGLKAYKELMKDGGSVDDMKQMQDIIDFLLDNNNSFIKEFEEKSVKNEQ